MELMEGSLHNVIQGDPLVSHNFSLNTILQGYEREICRNGSWLHICYIRFFAASDTYTKQESPIGIWNVRWIHPFLH